MAAKTPVKDMADEEGLSFFVSSPIEMSFVEGSTTIATLYFSGDIFSLKFGLLLVVSSDLLLCLVLRAVWEDSRSLSSSTGCCAQMFEFVVGWGFATRLLLRLVRLRVPERTLFLSWEAIGRVVNISTIAWLVIDEAVECASKKTSYGLSYETHSNLRVGVGGGNMVDEVNLGAAEGAQDVVKIKELRKALKSLLRIKAEGASSSDFFLFSGKLGVLDRYTPT
ncbi:hypothetical protein AT2G14700 [Arabidopsis thaliana]|uniref:Uncharacterized protein At2g14700 n=1 Tax=Arabidopsis thaliana TaxID=3702 RepID=Q9ZVK9_ARATH|nr:uncharacterized protein AT2G14700 [Arabidopsis thaliana]AAC69372.1 hypothetical protein [Arabidopsis thaliana]AEC06324.1 hypothetical protein AT2G14700 [Arabidopsis thaliana]|eukprot:NP_179077.1 hypothetical protein AT2G14700 [Arabidopsis thaliana]